MTKLSERITRQWNAGAELSAALNADFASGRATRPACEVEAFLTVCRRCPVAAFRGDRCAEIDLDPGKPAYHELLTRAESFCRCWSAVAPYRAETSAQTTDHTDNTDSARRADEITGRIARMHREGPTKSQAVRKLERNEARRRAQRKKRRG